MPNKGFIPNKLKPWIAARKKFHLSHAQIQMARELGLNPKKFGGFANHKQEQWKITSLVIIILLYIFQGEVNSSCLWVIFDINR